MPWPRVGRLSITFHRAEGAIGHDRCSWSRGKLFSTTYLSTGRRRLIPRVDQFMLRSLRFAALSFLAATLTSPVQAENTPAPPDWLDGRGASVYSPANQSPQLPAATVETARYAVAQEPLEFVAPPAAATPLAAELKPNTAVQQAAHEEATVPSSSMARRLAPPRNRDDKSATQIGLASAGARRLADFGVPVQSIYTVVTALAIVLGAFLLFAWALRRGGKNSGTRRGLLPADAVSVLGRVPLAARQFADLLRVGNKLVLVAQTPSGPTTLTEITDPMEVDRLVGMCQQFDPQSTTKAFEQVFQQLSSEPTSGGFLDDPLPASLSSATSAYRSHRGATRV